MRTLWGGCAFASTPIFIIIMFYFRQHEMRQSNPQSINNISYKSTTMFKEERNLAIKLECIMGLNSVHCPRPLSEEPIETSMFDYYEKPYHHKNVSLLLRTKLQSS